MASEASTIAANERVSIIPSASAIFVLPVLSLVPVRGRAPAQSLDGVLGCGAGDVDVAVRAGEVDAPERAEGHDLEHVDARRLLRLVRRERRVRRGLHL